MKTFRQFIIEGKLLSRTFGTVHEPSHEQISKMLDKSTNTELRAVRHPTHGLFVAPAERATHSDIVLNAHKKHGFDMDGTWKQNRNYMVGRDKNNGNILLHHVAGHEHIDHPSFSKMEKINSSYDYGKRRITPFPED